MGRAKQRADRIRAEIPIIDLLHSFGYAVHPGGGDREQQFSCDLHGDGSDNKPSARVYPDSASWYCFACSRSRDAIETVREKEGVDFSTACKLLEARFGLPPLQWDDASDDPTTFVNPAKDILNRGRSWSDEVERSKRFLDTLTKDHDVVYDLLLGWWEAHDMIAHKVRKKDLSEEQGVQALARLREKILARLREFSEEQQAYAE